jgi:methionine-rich copper-binding protein CopC
MTPVPHRRRPGAIAASIAALTLLLLPATVLAHAELETTTPDDGAVVEGTPTEIVATFSEALDDGSSLSLRDAAGDEVARSEPDPDDPTRMVIADVPELAPGAYTVRWTASSDDGHLERDTWSFTVAVVLTPSPTTAPTASATPAPSTAPTPTVAPTPSSAASPTASPAPGDGDPTSGTDVLIPIIAGLAIVAIAGGVLLSRRGRA